MIEKCDDVNNRKKKIQDFDDVLPFIGDFGKYQWILMISLVPFGISFAYLYYSQIFIMIVPQNHWCKIDELINLNLTQEQRINLAIPKSKNYPYYDRCHYKNLDFQNINITNINFNSTKWNTDEIEQCKMWEYDFNEIPYATISSELNWVCEKEYIIATVQAIFYVGSVFGNFIFGWISDRYGRIKGLLCCTATSFIATIGIPSTHSFWSFAICRFFAGFAYDNFLMIPLIIALEYLGVQRRPNVGCILIGILYFISVLTISGSAYFIRNWRYFTYICSASFLFCFFLTFLMPESTRWYMSKGNNEKILIKLRRISKINNKNPKAWVYDEFLQSISNDKKNVENASLLDLRRTPHLARNTILLAIIYGFSSLIMDTYIYFSNRYNISVFMSFVWFSVEIVIATTLVKIFGNQWGRRFSVSIALLLSGVFSIIFTFNETETIKIIAGCLGRMCMSFVQIIYVQYVPEFFPTSLRTQGTALVHFLSIIMHFTAPYVTVLIQRINSKYANDSTLLSSRMENDISN
ncbi:carcinine transporter-like isoform X2 [Leptopilina boulardi]|uniref:carcinine transporter-like isoform X2 n=1 Tax=Leptopilina boulardi TaxID=63433 RepID=UPI0021F69A11|nr:carcinine transporter-like isoform X2 [Leptopilina boulardi]